MAASATDLRSRRRFGGTTAALVVGFVAFGVVLAALALGNGGRRPNPPLPRSELRSALLADGGAAAYLGRHPWDSLRAVPLDEKNWRVTVLHGEQAILDATVGDHGQVSGIAEHPDNRVAFGSRELWSPALLALLTLAFCATLAVFPLRSVRNLDVLVIGAGFCLELLLYGHRLVRPHILVASAVLTYIAARTLVLAFRPRAEAAEPIPLWRHVAAALPSSTAQRLGVVVVGATLALGLMLIVTSTGISDIALVNLAGATLLSHGSLPYGNFPPELGHGDTYPLFSYLLFVPSAAFWPVHDAFDDLQGALNVNALAYVAAGVLIYRTVADYVRDRGVGVASALAWLLFPPVLLGASGGTNDVPTAALVALSLFLWRKPAASGAALAAAAWSKAVPVLALPIYLALYWGRRLPRAIAGVVVACAAAGTLLIAFGGPGGIGDMLAAMRFQTERGSLHALWWQFDLLWAQLAFEAAACGFVCGAAALVVLRPELRRLHVVAGLSAVALILVQLAGNYWNATYLAWVMPYILMGMFTAPSRPANTQVT